MESFHDWQRQHIVACNALLLLNCGSAGRVFLGVAWARDAERIVLLIVLVVVLVLLIVRSFRLILMSCVFQMGNCVRHVYMGSPSS